jgi:hypothetical protein
MAIEPRQEQGLARISDAADAGVDSHVAEHALLAQ